MMPPGFKFRPEEEELVNHYLYRKIYGCLPVEDNERDGLVIPDHYIIPDIYIYDHDPWELKEFFGEHSLAQLNNGECYFFCPRRDKNRATKSGYWKQRGQKRTIRTPKMTAEKIGLTFYQGRQQNGIVTEYKMHKYRPISSNMNHNITLEKMPYDLCYIFMKKTTQNQGDNDPLYNGSDSSTTVNCTTSDSNIYISQIQNEHQQDQTTELEETYSSQPPMYHDRSEIYPIQQYDYMDRELAFPSTAHAYARSFNSQMPGDHLVGQPMELEEIYNSLPQLDDNFNMIYPPSA